MFADSVVEVELRFAELHLRLGEGVDETGQRDGSAFLRCAVLHVTQTRRHWNTELVSIN